MKTLTIVFNLAVAGFMVWSAVMELRAPSPAYGIKAVFVVHR